MKYRIYVDGALACVQDLQDNICPEELKEISKSWADERHISSKTVEIYPWLQVAK